MHLSNHQYKHCFQARCMSTRSSLEVVHCDDALLVVNKPPGVLSQADATGDPDVLALAKAWLARERADTTDPFLGLVHRLDRPASGLMVLARTSAAARHLSRQFRERAVTKRYFALVQGTLRGLGRWEDYLLRDDRTMRVASPDNADAQRAVLEWQSIAPGDTSLVQARLHTGRRHQIRVQFAHRGYPILGDFRYGATMELDGLHLALHAYHLAFEHPVRNRGVRWVVEPPACWKPALHHPHRTALDRLMPSD